MQNALRGACQSVPPGPCTLKEGSPWETDVRYRRGGLSLGLPKRKSTAIGPLNLSYVRLVLSPLCGAIIAVSGANFGIDSPVCWLGVRMAPKQRRITRLQRLQRFVCHVRRSPNRTQ